MTVASPAPLTQPASDRRTVPVWICAAAVVAITGIAAVALRWLGRLPFSASGVIKIWSGDAWGPENSQQLFDPYTFTHVTHGLLFYGVLASLLGEVSLRLRAVIAVAVEAAWEVLENTNAVIDRYREATLALGYYGDSVLNSVGDIAACVVGFALAANLRVRTVVALAVVLEIVLTVAIRDSLLLNIVMLIYPLEAVKTWQLGVS